MPNTGRPSRDCHLCRQRRVKCDLGRPQCQRCIKYGAECPGYRDQQELVFRNADPTTIKKRKKRQQQSPPTTDDDHDPSPAPPESDISTPTLVADGDFLFTDPFLTNEFEINAHAGPSTALMLTRPLFEHWTNQSIPILLNVYDNLDFIKNIYRDQRDNGPLIWAAHLFSRTYVTNLRNPTARYKGSETETQKELGSYLGKTLSSVSHALTTPEGTKRDDVLATVWILASYELLVGSLSRMQPHSPWHLHTRGLYSILKSRGTAPLYTATGRTSFWPAYNMVQIQCLVTSTECPPETDEWFEVIEKSLYPGEGLTLYVSKFIAKFSAIQSRILGILRRRDFPLASSEFYTLFNGMIEAQQQLQDYIDSKVGDHVLDLYMVNLQHSACVKGYHIMQLLVNFLTHYAPCPIPLEQLREHRAFCLQQVHSAAEGILENMPQALGPLAKGKDKSPKVLFDALKVVWPLICIFIIPSGRPEHRLAAEGILVYIGKELGVRQALNTYPGDMLLPQEAQEPLGEHIRYGEGDCWH
ncbi:hypothetical protein PT974_11512 [Cladobotryum mycophilum]|uniref:Zn(2)-C6 fungal-type domain-containing protein n=1 Tax=Cladobotryum mycophilum TaxID=491253 RepID=A0ABR0S5F4_9HYPO